MKARWTFILLSVAVLLAIGLAAWLTNALFDLEIEETAPPTRPVQASQPASTTTTVIEVAQPAPEEVAPELPVGGRKPDVAAVPAEDFVAEVTFVAGKAFSCGKDKTKGEITLKPGMRLGIGGQIRTDPASRVELKLGDGSSMAVSERSVFVIDEFVYNPKEPRTCCFSMRVIEGLCKIVTGAVTSVNPERFRVKTRMATMGIRGCELAFRTGGDRDDIYILGLSGPETVIVEYNRQGSIINDVATGNTVEGKPGARESTTVSEPGTIVSVVRGQGAQTRKIGPEDLRILTSDLFFREAVQYKATVRPDSTVFEVVPRPGRKQTGARR